MKSLPGSGPPLQRKGQNIVQEKLTRAVSFHQQGNLVEAKRLYEEILKSNKTHFDALHLLGLIHHQTNNSVEAERLLSKAIRANSAVAALHYNYGLVLHKLGRFDEAVESYDRAIALKPDYAEAYSNRGITLHELKRFGEALKNYDRSIALKPNFAEAYSGRGSTLQELKRFDGALASYDRAIALKPDYAETHYNRGNALQELARFDEALASYGHAIALMPDFAQAHANRGSALKELKRFDEALASYDRAIEINPGYAEAHSNRGSTLKELKRFDDAIVSHNRAIGLRPDFAEAHYNRGLALHGLGRYDEAFASYDRAIELRPDFADAHWSKGMALLLRGDFQNGWQMYEWRWKSINFTTGPLVTSRAPWAGDSSKRVLVWPEQGVGDELMFSSLLSELQKVCSKTIVKVDGRLIPLLARSMSKEITFVPRNFAVDEVEYDEQISIGSLCKYFRTSESSFGSTRGGYIRDDKEKTDSIRRALKASASSDKKLCGISWRSKNEKTGADRSLTLRAFIEMLSSNDADFVSLQYGDTSEEIEQVRSELGVAVLSYKDVDNFNDIDGLASLIQACDVVVSVDNTTVHLAGALGKDTRVLLPRVHDWRWILDRNDSPWYSSVKLYRQDDGGDWVGVFRNIRADLSRL